ncbi:exported hypothetical protein [Actinacidiphila cocklensis]|uniref:Uncharacterized protein n=1 Tax=Actinacidiphila cocklensis TaxID=887465 RepID=A0A9W4GUD4_9ACTN|nr:exported hypothetical protein [Actinacidiphila cocklensis]
MPASACFSAASSFARLASLKVMSPWIVTAGAFDVEPPEEPEPLPDPPLDDEPAPLLLHAAAPTTTASTTAAAPQRRPSPARPTRPLRTAPMTNIPSGKASQPFVSAHIQIAQKCRSRSPAGPVDGSARPVPQPVGGVPTVTTTGRIRCRCGGAGFSRVSLTPVRAQEQHGGIRGHRGIGTPGLRRLREC